VSAPREALGSWTCPSGNSVDVFLRHEAPGLEHLEFEWDTPPPLLRPDDRAYYLAVILPAVHRRIAEFQERPVGAAIVLTTVVEPDA
jgi:hypothetical protein